MDERCVSAVFQNALLDLTLSGSTFEHILDESRIALSKLSYAPVACRKGCRSIVLII